MAEILNVASLHNNGKTELHVGIRNNTFSIKYNDVGDITFSNKEQKKASLDIENLKATNVYTKEEIDEFVEGIFTYRGEYTTFRDLTNATNNGDIVPRKGWVMHITEAGYADVNGTKITAHSHVVFNGERWIAL